MIEYEKNKNRMQFNAIDLFAGCGGLTQGMKKAGFSVIAALELDSIAASAYKLNHPVTTVIQKDIRNVLSSEIKQILGGRPLHLLAGCPPCQGFSTLTRLNKKRNIFDERNDLILEYFRMVKELKPLTIMMENVPGLRNYHLFEEMVRALNDLGYRLKVEVVNAKDYGVPQNRRQLVMIGSLMGKIDVAKRYFPKTTVRDTIFSLELPSKTSDPLHKIIVNHSIAVRERIKLTPKNGGSWKDLPSKYILNCHKNDNVGFDDVYGRLQWDECAVTITGGCLSPSKGRFLHPEQDRGLTPREAALLQSFPTDYKFPLNAPKQSLALLIGNALPPKLAYYQSKDILAHMKIYYAPN